MKYKLKFLPSAMKEWTKLGATVKDQFKKKLSERLENPFVTADRLNGLKEHYKIKLRASGYRLEYKVIQNEICIIVVAVNKRDKDLVYKLARDRINKSPEEDPLDIKTI